MADILTPTLGESVSEASIAKWTRKVGDAVKKDEVLVELETDKVSLEVVAPADGVLSDIKAGEGDTVVPGAVLGVVTEGASAAPAAAKPAPKAEKAAEAPVAAAPAAAPASASAPAAGSATVAIPVPTMGESVAEGTMGKWLKKNGEAVKKDELLVEIETDKVAVEVAAPADGVLTISADEGATVTPARPSAPSPPAPARPPPRLLRLRLLRLPLPPRPTPARHSCRRRSSAWSPRTTSTPVRSARPGPRATSPRATRSPLLAPPPLRRPPRPRSPPLPRPPRAPTSRARNGSR